MASILTENFNSYSTWALVWQWSWVNSANWGSFTVENTVVQEWANAVQATGNIGAQAIVYKIGTSVWTGSQAFYVRKTNTTDSFSILLEENASVTGAIVQFSSWWQIQYFNWASYVNIQAYSANQWYLIEVEWRTSDDKAQYRVDWWSWTWYFAVNWTFTALDRIRLIFWTSSTWTAYVDNFYDPTISSGWNSGFLMFFM